MTAGEKRTPSVENFSVPHNTHYWTFPEYARPPFQHNHKIMALH